MPCCCIYVVGTNATKVEAEHSKSLTFEQFGLPMWKVCKGTAAEHQAV